MTNQCTDVLPIPELNAVFVVLLPGGAVSRLAVNKVLMESLLHAPAVLVFLLVLLTWPHLEILLNTAASRYTGTIVTDC